jgi:hypothetical protein
LLTAARPAPSKPETYAENATLRGADRERDWRLVFPGRAGFGFRQGAQVFSGRTECAYSITSVLEIAKPFDIADMTDDHQDARLLSQNENSATVEVTYHPSTPTGTGSAKTPIGGATMAA